MGKEIVLCRMDFGLTSATMADGYTKDPLLHAQSIKKKRPDLIHKF